MKKSEKSSSANPVQSRKTSTIDITNGESNMAILSVTVNGKRLAKDVDAGLTDPMNPNGTMVLLDKFKVDTGYFEIVESRFSDIYPFLLEDIEYTAQDLIGEDLWADQTGIGQRHAVLCLKHLAQQPGARLIDRSCLDFRKSGFQIANK